PNGPDRILFSRWKITAEGVSPVTAKIRRAGDFAFQPGAFPSHPEDLQAAHGDGLWRAGRNAGADDWKWARGLRRAQGWGREHGASGPCERLRNDVSPSVAPVRAQRRTHRDRQNHRV